MADESKDAHEIEDRINAAFRITTTTIIGEIPVVGGLASAILGEIWPNPAEERNAAALKRMEDRIMQQLKDSVARSELERVSTLVEGNLDLLKKYTKTKPPDQGTHLLTLSDMMETQYKQVYTNNNPERFYLQYVIWATLHLAVLRDLAYHYEEICGKKDTNAADTLGRLFTWQVQHIDNIEDLRVNLLAWRMNNISDSVSESTAEHQVADNAGDLESAAPSYHSEYSTTFEWHDTISGYQWKDSNTQGSLDSRRDLARTLLESYRNGMYGERQESFKYPPEPFDFVAFSPQVKSYAYSLARDFNIAHTWRDFVYPQGPAKMSTWNAIRLERSSDGKQLDLIWQFDNGGPERRFTSLEKYVGVANDAFVWFYPHSAPPGATSLLDPGPQEGTRLERDRNGNHTLYAGGNVKILDHSLSEYLVPQDGELRPVPVLPEDWTWGVVKSKQPDKDRGGPLVG